MVRISFFTCVFLIGLRLVIGWHFFFEGLNKYESVQKGKTEYGRPFTSAPYFAEAQGPLAPTVREQLGDPDSEALAKLKPAPEGSEDRPATRMPAALAKEWDDYVARFKDEFKLDEATRKLADVKLEQAKLNYVYWLTDSTPKPKDGKDGKKGDEPKKIKRRIVTAGAPVEYEVEDKVQQRILDYELTLREVRDHADRRLKELGNVEKVNPRLRALKAEAAVMRAELLKDVDDHTDKLRKSLAGLVSAKLAGFSVGPAEDPGIDGRVLAMLKPREGTDASAERMPAALEAQWDEYAAYVRETGKESLRADAAKAEAALADAKLRYVRWLLDLDPFDGRPLPEPEVGPALAAYHAAAGRFKDAWEAFAKESEFNPVVLTIRLAMLSAAAPDVTRLRKAFIADITTHTDYLKKRLGGFDSEAAKGVVAPEKETTRFLWRDWPTTKQEWLDWSTRWLLLVAGGCLLVGLFGRLAALACASFLVFEYLFNSPFPWLPAPPKSEGNYVYVNKNVVEFMALLVLATVPTGRWFGLDAILSRIWPFRSNKNR